MANNKRNFTPNTYYHIYNRGVNKESIFKHAKDKMIFTNYLYKYIRHTDLQLDTYTVMNSHFHIILKSGKKPYLISKYMQKVCTAYAIYANKKYSRVGHLFQSRYQAKKLRFKRDRKQTREYIQQNPVKAGYVKTASAYPWTKKKV